MKQSTFSAVMANSIKNLLQGYTKGIRFVAVLTMLLIVGIGQAWAETKTYSYTFTAKQFSANGSKTLNNVSWTLEGNGGYWGYDGTKGQQFGSSNKPYKTLTLSTSEISGTITKIIINTSGGSSVNASFTVSVGGTQYGSSTKLMTTAAEYTFTGSESGEIKFSYTQTSSKALYIKSISVTYETAAATTYTVTYDKNGATSGTVPTDATQYNSGATVTVKTNDGNLAKTGHIFGGWNTKADGTGTNYTAGSGTFYITGNTTLYAKWTAKQTNISINANTDNHGSGSGFIVVATYGQALPSFAACAPATGYELVGYYTSATGGTKVIAKDGKLVASVSGYTDANSKWINESASLTLHAQYSAISYTVTYNGNNGTTSCAGGTYTYNSSFDICSDEPTRTGYTFKGWSDGTNTYQPGDSYTMPAKNVTFTAQWTINTYTVTWKVDQETKTEIVNHGAKVADAPTIDPNNLPCGQKFAGWTVNPITGMTDDVPEPLYETVDEIPAIIEGKTFHAVFADYAD